MEVHFKDLQKLVIDNISVAQRSIYIAVAWFTDEKIIKLLDEKLRQGVEIKVLFYKHHINKKENFYNLHCHGAKIKWSQNLMHHKFCIVDGKKILSGSYNFTTTAKNNDENITVSEAKDVVGEFLKQFNELFSDLKSTYIPFRSPEELILEKENEKSQYLQKNNIPTNYFPYFHLHNLKKNYGKGKLLILIRGLEDIDYLTRVSYFKIHLST
jgi:phosphatidylserine/phosphatidylglycerophosphate/cardiolipin synthase-like enzyme